ncbi:MAG TPA: glutaredoxin family protein [Candidatus Thermoplasmatota archaeon]|nr:glutaredoxin family protein [Candidatus Thermoplasmatota archaeon]
MRGVGLDTYRWLTLAGSLAGAALFGAGLVALVQLVDPALAVALMLAGTACALATAFVGIEGAPPTLLPSMLLYTRPDCALCDEARALLDELRRDAPFDVWEVDITGQPELEQRYGTSVPVGVARGSELFRLRVDEASVRGAMGA